MQASSITEALLMSPRSMSSTTTKASPLTPATPAAPAPLTRPSHYSPSSPFPPSPLSPPPAESARHDAHGGSFSSNNNTVIYAGHSNTSGAEQVQSGEKEQTNGII